MYVKQGTYNTLDEYVYAKLGKTVAEINQYRSQYNIPNLDKAADMIKREIAAGNPIVVYADYDVDGFTSAAQFIMLLSYLRANFWVYGPRRSTDGYGLSPQFIDRLQHGAKGLLITVDNGIAASEAVLKAKQSGWQVLIMDHHEIPKQDGVMIVPQADLIIDPEVFSKGCDFVHYCGAGLTYRLAELLVNDQNLLDQLCSIAAIGTVSDVVSLTEENRRLVQRGLDIINSGRSTIGVNKIIERLQKTGLVTSSDIGFGIGPMLNAASRLETTCGPEFSGTDYSIAALLCNDEVQAAQYAMQLNEFNLKRKEITKTVMDNLSTGNLDPFNFIQADAPAGILGIIAARVSDQTGKPTFIYSEKNGKCAGSARAGKSQNNVKAILDTVQDLMIACGGHPEAAGFSFKAENKEKIYQKLLEYPKYVPGDPDTYDLDLNAQLIMPTLVRMDQLEPFGKDFERPVFKIKCNFEDKLEFWHALGGDTLKLDIAPNVSAICFNEKENFMAHGSPRQMTIYGTPQWNIFRGNKTPQFVIDKIEY